MARLARERTGPGLVATASLAVIAVALLGLLTVGTLSWLDPFGSTDRDRSGPAVLERIRTLEEFTAAEASFTQDVDLERDTRFLPDVVKGERTVAIVTGRVRATVDLGALDAEAVHLSSDRRTIRLALPDPVLSDAEIEESTTRVVSRQRGIIDRIGDAFADNPVDDRELYRAAERKLEAAAADSGLVAEARTNTERWLTEFLGTAGFERVELSWATSPA
jgi:hypothetical protein